MAKLVLTNASVTFQALDFSVTPPVPVGSTYDLSDHIASISLATQYDIVETTQFGDTSKRRIAGLADNTVTFEFHQDFQAGSVESIIYPLLGTAARCVVKPIDTAVSVNNPKTTSSSIIKPFIIYSKSLSHVLINLSLSIIIFNLLTNSSFIPGIFRASSAFVAKSLSNNLSE